MGGLKFYSILRDFLIFYLFFFVEYLHLQDEYGRVCLKMFHKKPISMRLNNYDLSAASVHCHP